MEVLIRGWWKEECRINRTEEAKVTIEDAARENKLAELEIVRQSFDDKNKRIWELEKKVELLEGLLNRSTAVQANFPQPQPLPAVRPAPRRWTVR